MQRQQHLVGLLLDQLKTTVKAKAEQSAFVFFFVIMNTRSILASLFVLTVLGTVLAGCGSSEAPTTTGSIPNQQKKTESGAQLDQNGEK